MVHTKACNLDCKEEEINPFDTNVSEEEMAQEDVAHLILDENDEIFDIES